MPRVVFTGGPGAGKTSTLAELARMGYAVAPDAARSIIAERRARGEPPRPDAATFAREVAARELAAWQSDGAGAAWAFFERGLVDAAGLLLESGAATRGDAEALVARHRYHDPVFVFPPWQRIYRRDDERDQDWPDAVAVHGRIVRWYAACGYRLHEVPRRPPAARARHVLRVLGVPIPR